MVRGKLFYILVMVMVMLAAACSSPPTNEQPTAEPDTPTEAAESQASEEPAATATVDENAGSESDMDATEATEGSEMEAENASAESAGGNLTLVYNDRALVLTNVGGADVDISRLLFIGRADEDDERFSDDALGTTLASGDCVAMLSSGFASSDLPGDWDCEPAREAALTTNVLFWRADAADDETFSVRDGDAEVGRCDTAGRAVGRLDDLTCSIEW